MAEPNLAGDVELYRWVAETLRPAPGAGDAAGLAVSTGVLTADTELAALPIDSFALVELVIELQDRYGVRFGHEDVSALRTLGDLAALVRARAGGAGADG